MRGRKPRRFLLAAHDMSILEQIARSRTLPWFQVQRARVVLAIAEGARVQTVAFQRQWDPSTVWRLCRRYEEVGLEGVLAEVPRAGHPAELLNHAFSYRYLKRYSWLSRQELIDHIDAAWPEYNQLYAHPFEWTWTNQKMRQWFAEHAADPA